MDEVLAWECGPCHEPKYTPAAGDRASSWRHSKDGSAGGPFGCLSAERQALAVLNGQ
jgi:hypothetical protein